MGILIITWNFPPRRGGMENLLSGLCSHLRKNHPLLVITSFASVARKEQDWLFRPRWPGLLLFFLYALCQGFFLLWRNPGVKVVLGGSAVVSPLVVLLAGLLRRKAVILVHGLDLIYPNTFYQILCVRWIRRCDGVIANSAYTASLAQQKEVERDSIHVIPPGVDMESFASLGTEAAKKEMGLEGRKVLLFVGRLARRKGIKEFLKRSFPKVVAEVPEVCFVIVGENPVESMIHRDDVMDELRGIVREMRLENHVRLLGWLNDDGLAKIYQASDLLVLPVLSMKDDVEGFGIVIVEAAAAGKPAVATRVGGIPDAIEDGKSGVLVEPGDYGLLSGVIIDLLQNDQARLALGQYAQRRAREEFSWEFIIRKYESVLNSLIAMDAP